MVKKSLLWVYRTVLSLVSIIVIIVLITALAIQFLVLPNIEQYKDKIAAFASQAAKQKVVIGTIKADWQGINPHLSLTNIDIFDAQNRPALQLKNTDLTLSWLSIPLLEPHLAKLIIRAPELTIRRITSGEIFVAGTSMQGESKPDLPNWLLRQSKLEVLDAKVIWLDEMRGAPALSLNKLNLEMSSPTLESLIKKHNFTLSALPSIGTNNPISFSGKIYGNDVSHIEQWRGSISLYLKNANIAAFKPWIDYPIDLQSGIGSTKVVVDFANHQLKSVESNVALDNVQIQLKANADPVVLNKLVGNLNWKNLSTGLLVSANQKNSGYSFNVEHLTLSTNNGLNLQDVTATYIEKAAGNTPSNKVLNLKLAHINLASISPYLVQLPLSAEVLQKIISVAPTGSLNDLALDWEGNQSATTSYQLSTKFSGLGIQAQNTTPGFKMPGFNNLTGEVKADQRTGRLKLYTQNAKLDFKDILRGPIPADKLDGDISWNIKGKETEIQASQLNFSNPHLSGTIDVNYLMDGVKGGYLDLKGKFGHGDAKYALLYYPTILGPATLHWLDTSILAGHAEDINLTVKGRLDDFPFVDSKNNLDRRLGLFKVTARISDGVIEYGTGWPTIEGLGLDLLFEGKRMELSANTGHIFGNQIIKSKTTIAQLDADNPILNIVSELKGPVTEGIKFVNNSPVATLTQGFTDDLKTSGAGKLSLNLKIPLNNIEAAQYKGLYQITNGSMENQSIPTLSEVNGLLEFTENSLTAKNIKANAFGAPLVFNLNSGKDKVIRITAKGKLNDAVIKQTLGKGANYISGNTDWTGDIVIQNPNVNIGIRADLFGMTSRLPAPLDKAANEHLSLRIDKKQEPNTDTIVVNLGNKHGAKLIRTVENGKLQLDRASINLNSAPTNTSEFNINNEPGKAKGLQVTGNLDYLDADAWRNVMHDLSDATKQEVTPPIQTIALKINALDIFNRRINQLKITNKPGREGLQVAVQSREITGDLQWQNQINGKLIARLSNLTVPDAAPNRSKPTVAAKDTVTKDFKKLDQDYPALDITSDSFEFNKKKLGGFELVAYPKNDNWVIQKLKMVTPDSTLSAEGEWNNWLRNPNTQFNVTWNINDLGNTLKRFGYPDTIKGGEGELSGRLGWAGSPHEFDTIGLNGNLQFEMRQGQILKVQPGVGRLLGLLSLQSLPRRLSLDFRDLFSNGFAFDKINATVKIDRGVLRSDNFTMTGPAANVTIKGETNLQKETQQLFVKVMPNISDSVSLAALAGGPVVGAVAFLAQKILQDPLNKIVSTEYEIIGTWDNPQEAKTIDINQESSKNSPLN